MSLGYGWHAELYDCDERSALYAYHTYDLSLPRESDGYGIEENDGAFWAFLNEDGQLEFKLERLSRYCSEDGFYSAMRLYHRCTYQVERGYEETGTFPSEVGGNV